MSALKGILFHKRRRKTIDLIIRVNPKFALYLKALAGGVHGQDVEQVALFLLRNALHDTFARRSTIDGKRVWFSEEFEANLIAMSEAEAAVELARTDPVPPTPGEETTRRAIAKVEALVASGRVKMHPRASIPHARVGKRGR